MEVVRVQEASRINEIVNHPAVFPWVAMPGQQYIDTSAVVANPNNVALLGPAGSIIFVQHAQGFYEMHTQVLPEGRGVGTIHLAEKCLHWLFTRTNAVEVVTRVPSNNLGARSIKHFKAHLEHSLENGWQFNGRTFRTDFYRLHLEDWARNTPALDERGRWFHDRLLAEYVRVGKGIRDHADDHGHDRLVGLTIEMFLAGNDSKAVAYFNRWAKVLGMHEIRVVSHSPMVIDIGTDVLTMNGDDFEVMKCQ